MVHCAGCFDQSEAKSRRKQIIRLQDFWVVRCGIKKERTRILDRGALPDLQTSNAGTSPDHQAPAIITPPFSS
ncbi:hypothetical protein TNCV_4149501 [Trichonephila clavipes]|nr:hypothetical protein TNCV_4149501 [Trichonephila clavipes]